MLYCWMGNGQRHYFDVAQGCSLSPILFSVFINGLLREVEEAEIGIDLSSGGRLGGLLFADDFVGVSESKDLLKGCVDNIYTLYTW